jgi:ubiquinone/menaquinone biosynthesis C-methylase UbiE
MNDNLSKFSDKAENYAKYRLNYPVEILNYFKEFNFNDKSIIADIGSGTGKLSKIFLENGNIVYAIEPNDDMRNMADSLFNGFKNYVSINGSAEKTTLQSRIIDFVVVGQAFHWFDAPKALEEIKRVLKNNGVLALIWYNRKTDTPFYCEYDKMLRKFPDYKGDDHRHTSDEIIEKYYSKDYKKITMENNHELTFTELLGSFSSSSYTPKEDTQEYNESKILLENIFTKYKVNDKVNFGFEIAIYIGII